MPLRAWPAISSFVILSAAKNLTFLLSLDFLKFNFFLCRPRVGRTVASKQSPLRSRSRKRERSSSCPCFSFSQKCKHFWEPYKGIRKKPKNTFPPNFSPVSGCSLRGNIPRRADSAGGGFGVQELREGGRCGQQPPTGDGTPGVRPHGGGDFRGIYIGGRISAVKRPQAALACGVWVRFPPPSAVVSGVSMYTSSFGKRFPAESAHEGDSLVRAVRSWEKFSGKMLQIAHRAIIQHFSVPPACQCSAFFGQSSH